MLNLRSSYFRDQLIETLQIKLATQELTLGPHHRITKDDESYDHELSFRMNGLEYRVAYNAREPKFSLPVALQLLADQLIETMHAYLKTRLMLEPAQ